MSRGLMLHTMVFKLCIIQEFVYTSVVQYFQELFDLYK